MMYSHRKFISKTRVSALLLVYFTSTVFLTIYPSVRVSLCACVRGRYDSDDGAKPKGTPLPVESCTFRALDGDDDNSKEYATDSSSEESNAYWFAVSTVLKLSDTADSIELTHAELWAH